MITADQFGIFYKELIGQAAICDKHQISRPPLILDRDTYNDLQKASVSWMRYSWGDLSVEGCIRSQICGFYIVIKDDLHAPNL